MFEKPGSPQLDNEIPAIDEGWWISVLSEEQTYPTDILKTDHKINAIQNKLDGVNWARVLSIFHNDEIINLFVYNSNRGGLLVEGYEIQGFVPVSHLVDMPGDIDDGERQSKLNDYLGTYLNLKVIECEPEQERIVFSERAALAGEGQRKMLFNTLKPGDKVSGSVTNITDFGVFIDLGGVEGLVHVSELSWGRVRHPSDIVRLGQLISAQVIHISEGNGRVALSLKRLTENPWVTFSHEYRCGDFVPVTVTAITRFGVFARLKEGIEGLIHVSSIDLPADDRELKNHFHPGQNLNVQIINIDAERRRLGLGLVKLE